MPGTIQVSVLDLMDLPSSSPSSSSSSSSISVKVSMGKREYQTFDKGVFSFPLTNLRDNLIVTLHDADQELSRTGVETMLIVEKGILDDVFIFEGGRRLHMTLKFILNDEERKRIQELRETALKKKHEELLTGSLRYSETASMVSVGGNVGSSSTSLNHSPEGLVQMEAARDAVEPVQEASISNSDNSIKDPIYDSGNGDGVLHDRLEKPVPNEIDESEGTSSKVLLSEEPKIQHSEAEEKILDEIETLLPLIDIPTKPTSSLEALDPQSGHHSVSHTMGEDRIFKIETRLPPTDIPMRLISSLGALDPHSRYHSVSRTSGENQIFDKIEIQLPPMDISIRRISSLEALDPRSRHRPESGTLEEDQIHGTKKDSALKQTPSNVRKMISAFESSRDQGLAPRVDAPTLRTQPNKIKGILKEPNLKEVTVEKTQMQQIAKTESSLSSIVMSQELNLSQSTNYVREQKDIGSVQHTKENIHEGETPKEVMKEKNKGHQIAESSLSSMENPNNIREQKDISLEKHSKENLHEHETSQDELTGVSTAETAMGSRQMPTRPVDTDQSCSANKDQHDSIFKVLEKGELRTCTQDTEGINFSGSSSKQRQVVADCRVDECPLDRNCILADESRCLCITTGSKQVMDLMGGCGIFEETFQREMSFSRTEAKNEGEACTEVNRHGKTSRNLTKREPEEGSVDVKVPGGLIGQAVRVAIMVAFGTLVLVARQRKN